LTAGISGEWSFEMTHAKKPQRTKEERKKERKKERRNQQINLT
jgi:hypothetical protein